VLVVAREYGMIECYKFNFTKRKFGFPTKPTGQKKIFTDIDWSLANYMIYY
jgi:hypothetical protein